MILIGGGGGALFENKYADPEKKKLTLNNLFSKYFVIDGDTSAIFFIKKFLASPISLFKYPLVSK